MHAPYTHVHTYIDMLSTHVHTYINTHISTIHASYTHIHIDTYTHTAT